MKVAVALISEVYDKDFDIVGIRNKSVVSPHGIGLLVIFFEQAFLNEGRTKAF